MRTRLLAALAALVLAVIGAVLVGSYVQSADQRALAGVETAEVLLVAKLIPAGTPAEQLGEFLVKKVIPKSAIAADALSELTDAGGKVAAIDLMPAEQLLSSRLVDPASLQAPGTVEVPEGMQEITIQLGADRTVGGRLAAGDTVGVIVSFADGPNAPTTQFVFHKVLITSIQGAPTQDPEAETAGAPPVPGGSMLVTFARSAPDAQKIVYAAQYGSIWLSKEPATADESGAGTVTRKDFPQ